MNRRIRDLGTLPVDAFEKYRGQGVKELHRALAKVAAELEGYALRSFIPLFHTNQ